MTKEEIDNILSGYFDNTKAAMAHNDFDSWIEDGDWTLLTVDRKTIAELMDSDELSEDQIEQVKMYDKMFAEFLSTTQLDSLNGMWGDEIKEWWGN